ncbi:MAG: GNAT family N-acetyltransferase [Anaerolineaceae bacterium]|nr:GNAT family N-acetyltransferase [Anaerolineaceae bacterium]
MLSVVRAATDEQIQHIRELFAEYFDFLRTDVDTDVGDLNDVPPLAGYEEEMATLPGRYAAPDGCLLLAEYEGKAAGCVAYYKLEDGICEIKRLWVRPSFRGKKISRVLVETLIEEARKRGYAAIVLSTVDILKEARTLYESLGFTTTAPYYEMPEAMLAHEVFMRLDLFS